MEKNKLIGLLKDYNQEDVIRYVNYLEKLKNKKNKDGEQENKFMNYINEEKLAEMFKQVARDGLVFDGIHISLQSTGISYDYVALKNKMLLVYPESIFDIGIVYEGDDFDFKKENGKIEYSHKLKNPFGNKDDTIIGAYGVIKNKRGEFLTTLSIEEVQKHRKVAKTDTIWKLWFKEMIYKTVAKKSIKFHFNDIYQNIEEIDNENYDLENPLELELKYKQDIDSINTLEGLLEYYNNNKGKGKDFDSYISKRKQLIINNNK